MDKVYMVMGHDYVFYCYSNPVAINTIFDDNIKLVEIVTKNKKEMKIGSFTNPIYTLEEAADVFYKTNKKYKKKETISKN